MAVIHNFEHFINESKGTFIEWYDYNEENLLEAYKDYVEEIEKDKDLHIVTNVLCMTKWTKPKINNGMNSSTKAKYITMQNKIMTSTLLISYSKERDKINFNFGNISLPLKFARMEDLDIS